MPTDHDAVEFATALAVAWLGNPNTRATADDVPGLLTTMHAAVTQLGRAGQPAPAPPTPEFTPAVSVRKSLASREHIVSMIDGKPYRALRRHLTTHGLTPDEYRARYNLKPDYPMVAAAYSEARRAMAKARGLGRKAGQKVERAADATAAKARRGGKTALAAAKKALGTA